MPARPERRSGRARREDDGWNMGRRLEVVIGVNSIVHSKGKILLLRRTPGSMPLKFAGRWDLPGGRVEPGESLERALRRELREETGLAPRIVRVVASRIVHAAPTREGIVVTFVCETRGLPKPRLAPKEHDRFLWKAPEAAVRLRPRHWQSIRTWLTTR